MVGSVLPVVIGFIQPTRSVMHSSNREARQHVQEPTTTRREVKEEEVEVTL